MTALLAQAMLSPFSRSIVSMESDRLAQKNEVTPPFRVSMEITTRDPQMVCPVFLCKTAQPTYVK